MVPSAICRSGRFFIVNIAINYKKVTVRILYVSNKIHILNKI